MSNKYFGYLYTQDGWHDEGTLLIGETQVWRWIAISYHKAYELRVTDEIKNATVAQVINGVIKYPTDCGLEGVNLYQQAEEFKRVLQSAIDARERHSA